MGMGSCARTALASSHVLPKAAYVLRVRTALVMRSDGTRAEYAEAITNGAAE